CYATECAASGGTCSGTPATCSVSGKSCSTNGTCTATASNFTTVGPPGYSYLASYHGDSNYPPIALPSALCEIVLVGKLDSQISTHIFEVRDAFGNVVPGQCATAQPVAGTCGPTAQSTAAVCSVTGNLCAKDVTDNFIDIGVATTCEAGGGTCD